MFLLPHSLDPFFVKRRVLKILANKEKGIGVVENFSNVLQCEGMFLKRRDWKIFWPNYVSTICCFATSLKVIIQLPSVKNPTGPL